MPAGGISVPGAVRGLLTIEELLDFLSESDRMFCCCTENEKREILVACSEQAYCATALNTGSSNSTFPAKSCACACNAFLAGIISSPVGSI